MKKSPLLSKIKTAIFKIEPAAEIILYGSRARDDFRENSDWDFLVLVDGAISSQRTDKIRRVLFEIELEEDQIISSIVRSRLEWESPKYSVVPLHRNIQQEGIHL